MMVFLRGMKMELWIEMDDLMQIQRKLEVKLDLSSVLQMWSVHEMVYSKGSNLV